jgi:hypothetical protein
VVAEVERGKAEWRFVELSSTRPFVTIEVRADGDDPMRQVQEAIAARNIQDAIVRLIVHTTAEKNHLIRDPDILECLRGAFKIAAMVRDVEHVSRLRLGGSLIVEQLTPLQFLTTYLQLNQVSRERTELLVQYARDVIQVE